MTNKSGITVEGVMLEEFIKDNELIKDEIERIKLVSSANDKVYINKHTIPKYKPLKEQNGEVKILDQIEKNKLEYPKLLEKALRDKDFFAILTIAIMVHPNTLLDLNYLTKFVMDFCKERDISYENSLNHALRAKIGYMKKSKFFEFVDYKDKKTLGNTYKRSIFSFDSDKERDLTLLAGIELMRTPLVGGSFKIGRPLNKKSTKIEDVMTAPKLLEIPNQTPAPKVKIKSDIEKLSNMDKVLASVVEAVKSGSLFNVAGDIHIHIHMGS